VCCLYKKHHEASILYGTTKRFLELFGLNSIKDLPQPETGALPATANPL
jgi:chromosome segregation and condensation protein ScpB